MQSEKVIIATRNSPLALWQAEHVKAQLLQYHPRLQIQLLPLRTEGDRILQQPLSTVGGKGLFSKELEQALQQGRADIAVHSMKDMTVEMPAGLCLPVMLQRGNPQDILVTNTISGLHSLPQGAVIGTSSLRRQCQLKAWRSDLQIKTLRGNIGTRLQKLRDQQYDAIVLAAAGVIRLNLQSQIRQFIPTDIILPAIGQGAIGIQIRSNDTDTLEKILPLNDESTRQQVETERIIGKVLFANCRLPIAAHAQLHGLNIELQGIVGSPDGSIMIRDTVSGKIAERNNIGEQLGSKLLAKGAGKILQELRHNAPH